MSDYQTKYETVTIADISLEVISLKDKNQFYDPDKKAEKLGISSNLWPISGLIWPSGRVLAKIINKLDLSEVRVLEVGCGIGIASLVAAYKQADISASDFHPLVPTFLEKNTKANRLNKINFFHGDWNYPTSTNGKFDLIIGSDLLYGINHYEILSQYIDCHLSPIGKVVLIDPGRSTAGKIKKSMQQLGYSYHIVKLNYEGMEEKGGYFTQYTFYREEAC